MIPKIIHYCWFGGKPKPKETLEYIETWRKFFPDYEIKEWNESNFDYKAYRYTHEAYLVKKFAYVSDVCRLKALYDYGGIYFDTDVEVVNDFSKFLNDTSFVGYEVENLIGTGVIGAQKHCRWLKLFLDSYKKTDFILVHGGYNLIPNTVRLTNLLEKLSNEEKPCIYPLDVFCAMNWRTHQVYRTEHTVSIHHYKASWKNNKKDMLLIARIEDKICRTIRLRYHFVLSRLYKKFLHLVINDKEYSR